MQLEMSFLQEACPKESEKRETVVITERMLFSPTCCQDNVFKIMGTCLQKFSYYYLYDLRSFNIFFIQVHSSEDLPWSDICFKRGFCSECKQNFQSGGLVQDPTPVSLLSSLSRISPQETSTSVPHMWPSPSGLDSFLPTQCRLEVDGVSLSSEFSPSL